MLGQALFAAAFLWQPLPDISEVQDFQCPEERRAVTSARLRELFQADQADRAKGPIDAAVTERDLERRKEVALIFAEGCIVTGEDHYNAARVYQHGTVPAHFYQVYLWASRAQAMGFKGAEQYIPRGIDRFLLWSGYKQLFGSNASADAVLDENGQPTGELGPWCLDPTVQAFTDEQRAAFNFPTLQERLEWAGRREGEPAGFCEDNLLDPPRGLFPGIW